MSRLFALLLLLLPTLNAQGEAWSFEDARDGFGDFALGFASSFVVHEATHFAVAKSKGYRVSHDGMSITYPSPALTPPDQIRIASAGLQAQWMLDELVLHDSGESKPSNFGAGVVCSQLGTTLAYLTVLKDHPRGDIAGMAEASKLSHDRLILLLAIPGLLDAWRLFGDDVPHWVPAASLGSKGMLMGWVWTY